MRQPPIYEISGTRSDSNHSVLPLVINKDKKKESKLNIIEAISH
jgi:hypothetical protein